MGDLIIRTADLLRVTLPTAEVPLLQGPVPLVGSGLTVRVQALAVCLLGDELPALFAGPLPYTAQPSFVIPGAGKLILALQAANLTTRTSCRGKPIILKGQQFPAQFVVAVPATMPLAEGPPAHDPIPIHQGFGEFVSTNVVVTAA